MLNQEMLPVGLTFDDVLLVPAESSIVPRDTDVSTILTERIKLNVLGQEHPGEPDHTLLRRDGRQCEGRRSRCPRVVPGFPALADFHDRAGHLPVFTVYQ